MQASDLLSGFLAYPFWEAVEERLRDVALPGHDVRHRALAPLPRLVTDPSPQFGRAQRQRPLDFEVRGRMAEEIMSLPA